MPCRLTWSRDWRRLSVCSHSLTAKPAGFSWPPSKLHNQEPWMHSAKADRKQETHYNYWHISHQTCHSRITGSAVADSYWVTSNAVVQLTCCINMGLVSDTLPRQWKVLKVKVIHNFSKCNVFWRNASELFHSHCFFVLSLFGDICQVHMPLNGPCKNPMLFLQQLKERSYSHNNND